MYNKKILDYNVLQTNGTYNVHCFRWKCTIKAFYATFSILYSWQWHVPQQYQHPQKALFCFHFKFIMWTCHNITLCLHCLSSVIFNPLNTELNSICYLLALLGDHHFLHVSRIRVKLLTFRLLMSYIYGAPFLGVSRSHATTQYTR